MKHTDEASPVQGDVIRLTPEERTLVLAHRKRAEYARAYNNGLEAAASQCEAWADECCGGSGEGGEVYRNIAGSIRKLFIDV